MPMNIQERVRVRLPELQQIARWPHLLGHLVGKTKLRPIHSEWIRSVWLPGLQGKHTALQAPRGHYKTTACTEVGSVWWLLFNPGDRLAIVRETVTEAEATLDTIAQMMRNEHIRALYYAAHGHWPAFLTDRADMKTFSFKRSNTKEGSLNAHGVDQIQTGRHYDVIHCDDIITRRDRLSRAKRERTKDAYREIATNIVDPGKSVHNVGTPWHRDDAWALCENVARCDVYQAGMLSEAEIEEKRSRTTRSLFAANYELRHVAEEDQPFSDPVYDPWSYDVVPVWAHLDAKFSGNHMNALTIMARRRDGKIQATGFAFPEHIEERVAWVHRKLMEFRCTRLHIETNPDKGFVARAFKASRVNAAGVGALQVFPYAEQMNKHAKILSFLKHYWTDILWDPQTDPEYLGMIVDYREGEEPDDAPDSAASLLRNVFYKQDPRAQAGFSALNEW